MSTVRLNLVAVSTLIAVGVTGCAGLGTEPLTTSSIGDQPKVDPACVTLTSQIDTLRKEGVADKVANAAAKKYKMSANDLAKADQLNKANAEFQAKCATITPAAGQQQATLATGTASVAPAATAPAAAAPVQQAAAAAPVAVAKATKAAKPAQ